MGQQRRDGDEADPLGGNRHQRAVYPLLLQANEAELRIEPTETELARLYPRQGPFNQVLGSQSATT
jgi:hypothetical protein